MYQLECPHGLDIIPDGGPRRGFWAGESVPLGRSYENPRILLCDGYQS